MPLVAASTEQRNMWGKFRLLGSGLFSQGRLGNLSRNVDSAEGTLVGALRSELGTSSAGRDAIAWTVAREGASFIENCPGDAGDLAEIWRESTPPDLVKCSTGPDQAWRSPAW